MVFTFANCGGGHVGPRLGLGLLVQGYPTLPYARYYIGIPFKACLVGLGYGVYFGQAAARPYSVINVIPLIGAGLPYLMRGQHAG